MTRCLGKETMEEQSRKAQGRRAIPALCLSVDALIRARQDLVCGEALLLIPDCIVGGLVGGSVDELVVVPACYGVVGGGVGDFGAKRVVHDALGTAHMEGDDVVLAWGIELARIPLERDPLKCA